MKTKPHHLQPDPLESEAFYDIMREYTIAVTTDTQLTIPALDAVKKWLRDNLTTGQKEAK